MIELIFSFGNEMLLVRIEGHKVWFSNSHFESKMVDISGLFLDKVGVIKKFPDLANREDWRQEAIRRFKEHISKMGSENEIADYIVKELKNKGYVPKLKQRRGFRIEPIK